MTRRQTFMENLAFIKAHNKLHSEGLSTFTVGINEFADMVGIVLIVYYNFELYSSIISSMLNHMLYYNC